LLVAAATPFDAADAPGSELQAPSADGAGVGAGRVADAQPPGAAGRHSVRARAKDASGNVQPEVPPWNRLSYGNNAVEVTYVDVR
jgi:hypothetical protein